MHDPQPRTSDLRGFASRDHRPPRSPVLGLLPAGASSQRRSPFRSGVELVQVDVVVVDKDGKHVRGLKAADFAVLDRDKPQTIATFEEVSHERPEAAPVPLLTRPARLDVGNNQTARSERLVVMVIDDLHIYKGRTERAQDIARQIISRLGPQASMAVLFTSANRNTQVTEDRAELLAAIDTLRGPPVGPTPEPGERRSERLRRVIPSRTPWRGSTRSARRRKSAFSSSSTT